MLTIKKRLMATAALLTVAVPAFLLVAPAAEAAHVSNVVIKPPVSGNLIADRHRDDDYEYSERHGRHRQGRYRRHRHKYYQYNSTYRTPVVIYNKPVGIYAPPPVIYAPAPYEKRCVRTLYSTICN